MLIYATLGLCAVLAFLLVIRYDLHTREPWMLLLLTAVLGAGSMAALGRTEDLAIYSLTNYPPCWLVSIVAASFEEAAKLAIVVLVAGAFRRHCSDAMDGLVYGSIAGLGMAIYESVDYMHRSPSVPAILPGPEIVRLFGHLILGGIGGYGMGLVCLDLPRAWRTMAGGLAAAVFLHFVVDWASLHCLALPRLPWFSVTVFMTAMLGGILLYGTLVVRASARDAGRAAGSESRAIATGVNAPAVVADPLTAAPPMVAVGLAPPPKSPSGIGLFQAMSCLRVSHEDRGMGDSINPGSGLRRFESPSPRGRKGGPIQRGTKELRPPGRTPPDSPLTLDLGPGRRLPRGGAETCGLARSLPRRA